MLSGELLSPSALLRLTFCSQSPSELAQAKSNELRSLYEFISRSVLRPPILILLSVVRLCAEAVGVGCAMCLASLRSDFLFFYFQWPSALRQTSSIPLLSVVHLCAESDGVGCEMLVVRGDRPFFYISFFTNSPIRSKSRSPRLY
jgi:hypothetical protein